MVFMAPSGPRYVVLEHARLVLLEVILQGMDASHAGQPKVAITARCPPFSILVHELEAIRRGVEEGHI